MADECDEDDYLTLDDPPEAIFLPCTCCKVNLVDYGAGYDTCDECLKRQ